MLLKYFTSDPFSKIKKILHCSTNKILRLIRLCLLGLFYDDTELKQPG